MAIYAVNDWYSTEGSLPTVLADLETKLETIDDSKTIHLKKVIYLPNKKCIGVLIYDA